MVVFISHEHSDDKFVDTLYAELRRLSHIVWVDHISIPPGTSWIDEIEKALQLSNTMILVMSSASTASENVRMEWGTFLSEHKRIIPIKLGGDFSIPLMLRQFQHLNYASDGHMNELLKALVAVLPPPDDDFPSTKQITLPSNFVPPPLHDTPPADKRICLSVPKQNKVFFYPIHHPFIVGRGTSADVDLTLYASDDQGVSRRHLHIAYTTDGIALTDLGSKNGTFIHDEQLTPYKAVVITERTPVLLGSFQIEIGYAANDQPTRNDSESPAAQSAMREVVIEAGSTLLLRPNPDSPLVPFDQDSPANHDRQPDDPESL